MSNIIKPEDFGKDKKQQQIDYLRVQVEAMKVVLRDLSNSFSALCHHLKVGTPELQAAFNNMMQEKKEQDKKLKELVK